MHAIRQMPDEKLDWSVPERKRPMREFTCHIFDHVRAAMESKPFNWGFGQTSSWIAYSSFQQIADYGRTIIEQYRDWAGKQDFNDLRKSSPEGSAEKSGAERLDISAGAVIQHLRQLYFILEQFGVTPEHRIPDSEWPSEYILTTLW